MVFGALAATCGNVFQTNDAALKFTHTFANSFAVPAEFAFGTAVAARAELSHCPRHKETRSTTLQRFGSFGEECLERVGQFHRCSSESVYPHHMIHLLG